MMIQMIYTHNKTKIPHYWIQFPLNNMVVFPAKVNLSTCDQLLSWCLIKFNSDYFNHAGFVRYEGTHNFRLRDLVRPFHSTQYIRAANKTQMLTAVGPKGTPALLMISKVHHGCHVRTPNISHIYPSTIPRIDPNHEYVYHLVGGACHMLGGNVTKILLHCIRPNTLIRHFLKINVCSHPWNIKCQLISNKGFLVYIRLPKSHGCIVHDDVIKWKHSLRYWPVTRSFYVFFDLRLNTWLSKQSGSWWFETLLRSFWRHSNVCALIKGVER